jgi:hypothetical protein
MVVKSNRVGNICGGLFRLYGIRNKRPLRFWSNALQIPILSTSSKLTSSLRLS